MQANSLSSREFEPSGADGGPPRLREGDWWQNKGPCHSLGYCYYHIDWLSLSSPTESPRTKLTAKTGTHTPERHDNVEIQLKPKARQIQNTAPGLQKWRVNTFDLSDHNKRAFKRAMSWYDWELQKGKAGLSLYKIAKRVKLEFGGAGPSAQTIQQYTNTGLAGLSPLKPGVKSDIPKWAYRSLCTALEIYVCINQLNRRDDVLMLKKLAAKVNEMMMRNYRSKLLNCMLLSTAKYLDASKMEYCEDRRIRWTTYSNRSFWFDSWEYYLVNLGFALYDKHGECIIPDEQIRNIINFDETCLSLDGSDLHDPRFP